MSDDKKKKIPDKIDIVFEPNTDNTIYFFLKFP